MAVTFNAADAPILVRYVFAGDWTAREFLDRRQELLRAGELSSMTAVLFDLRQARGCPPLGDLHPSLHATTTDGIWPACRAFVVSTEEQHNCARQLQALLGPHSVVNEIFRDDTAALLWLSVMASQLHSIRA
jgi:hypothetical protein